MSVRPSLRAATNIDPANPPDDWGSIFDDTFNP